MFLVFNMKNPAAGRVGMLKSAEAGRLIVCKPRRRISKRRWEPWESRFFAISAVSTAAAFPHVMFFRLSEQYAGKKEAAAKGEGK